MFSQTVGESTDLCITEEHEDSSYKTKCLYLVSPCMMEPNETLVTAVVVSRCFVFALERTLTLISPYTHANTHSNRGFAPLARTSPNQILSHTHNHTLSHTETKKLSSFLAVGAPLQEVLLPGVWFDLVPHATEQIGGCFRGHY